MKAQRIQSRPHPKQIRHHSPGTGQSGTEDHLCLGLCKKSPPFQFRQLLEKQTDKLEVVVTFLAILELMKIGKIHLTQEETFGEMDH